MLRWQWLERQSAATQGVVGSIIASVLITLSGWAWNHYGSGPAPSEVLQWLAVAVCIAVIAYLLVDARTRRRGGRHQEAVLTATQEALAALRTVSQQLSPPVRPTSTGTALPSSKSPQWVDYGDVKVLVTVSPFPVEWISLRDDLRAKGPGHPYTAQVAVSSTAVKVLENLRVRFKDADFQAIEVGSGGPGDFKTIDEAPVRELVTPMGDLAPGGSRSVKVLFNARGLPGMVNHSFLWFVEDGGSQLASGGHPGIFSLP